MLILAIPRLVLYLRAFGLRRAICTAHQGVRALHKSGRNHRSYTPVQRRGVRLALHSRVGGGCLFGCSHGFRLLLTILTFLVPRIDGPLCQPCPHDKTKVVETNLSMFADQTLSIIVVVPSDTCVVGN